MSDDIGTLVITGVDLGMLEDQRIELGEMLFDPAIKALMTEYQEAALTGISNMLDEWADERDDCAHSQEED